MIQDREYHWNGDNVCVDPDFPVRITTPQCEVVIKVARDRRSWYYGLGIECIDEGWHSPCSRDDGCSRYNTSREAVLAALKGAKVFFLQQLDKLKDERKEHIINPMLARINLNLLDYSTPSLFEA